MREFGMEEFLFILIVIILIIFIMGVALDITGLVDLGLKGTFSPWNWRS